MIPPIPKFSTNTLATFGERNAGNVGPKWMFLIPKCNNDNNTITAFCSYQAMLYEIGNSFTLSTPNTSASFNAITTNEYESLHCPASSTLGIPFISPRSNLLYLYLAHPAVNITASFGNFSANSV